MSVKTMTITTDYAVEAMRKIFPHLRINAYEWHEVKRFKVLSDAAHFADSIEAKGVRVIERVVTEEIISSTNRKA